MNCGEWAWLLIFHIYRAIYLAHGGWATVLALVGSIIPIVGVGVGIWGLVTMHQVYGCKTVLTTLGIWFSAGLVYFLVLMAVSNVTE